MKRKPTYDELEKELKTLRERDQSQILLDIAGVMFVTLDTKGIVTLVNKKACEIFGYEEREMLGKNWFENFLPKRIRKEVLPISKKILSGEIETIEYYENPILTKNGEEKLIYWHNTPIRDENGNITGLLSSGEDITERKKAEEQFQIIAENTSDNIAITSFDLKAKYLYVSPSVKPVLGYEPEDLIGKSFFSFIHPEDKKKLLPLLKSYINVIVKKVLRIDGPKINERVEFRFKNKAGKWRYMQSTINLIGKNLIAVTRDITDNKKSEEALKKSEAKFKKLSNLTFEGIIIHDQGIAIDINLSLVKMFGYKREEILGKNVIKLFVPEKYHGIIYENIIKNYTLPYEIEGIKKDGSLLPIELEGKNIKTEDGNKTVRVIAVRDISLRKKTEKEIKKLSTAVEQSANTIVITDTEGNIEYTNPKFTELTGYTAKEALGQNPRILNAGIQPKEYYVELWQTITAGKIWNGEFCNKTKSGSLYWEQVVITPIKDDDGKIINFLAIKEDITARKRVETALKESEIKFRGLFNGMSLGVVSCKAIYNEAGEMTDCIYQDINVVYEKFTGLNKEIAIGKKVSEMLPETEPEWFSTFGEVVQTGNSISFEMYHDNSNKYYLVFAYRSAKDEFSALLDDITERKKAEEKLKESEERFRTLVKNMSDYVFLIDSEFKVIMLNQAASELARSKIENITGRHLSEIFPPNIANKFEKDLRFVFKTNEQLIKDSTIKTGNSEIVINTKLNPILNDKGKVIAVIGVSRDITERKEAEERLKESESYNKALFYRSHTPLVVMDMNTYKFIDCNEAAVKIYGYKSKEEVIGKTPLDVSTQTQYNEELSANTAKDKIDEALKKGFVLFEWRHQKPNGEIWDAEVHLMSIKHKGKKILKFSLLDITDRKKVEQALKQSEEHLKELNATKDKFFSIIAHDLKSPFNSMLGFSELLMKRFDKYDIQHQKKFISNIYYSIHNTYKLLENLLLWSSTQRGIIDFNPEPENLYLILVEIIELLSQSATNKSINIKNDISEDIFVKADKNMLSTILRNLISNAIKFTHKAGEIIIEAQLRDDKNKQDFIEISVCDNGVGIKPEVQSKLFSISENISTKGTENEPGTGLGLILCKEFVEKQGGKIWMESEVENVTAGKVGGSKFIFTIPILS